MAWRLEQDVTAAVFPDLHFPDGNQGEQGHNGVQRLVFDGGDESAPPRVAPPHEPQGDRRG